MRASLGKPAWALTSLWFLCFQNLMGEYLYSIRGVGLNFEIFSSWDSLEPIEVGVPSTLRASRKWAKMTFKLLLLIGIQRKKPCPHPVDVIFSKSPACWKLSRRPSVRTKVPLTAIVPKLGCLNWAWRFRVSLECILISSGTPGCGLTGGGLSLFPAA